MKNFILISIICLSFVFFSCKKENIEPVNLDDSTLVLEQYNHYLFEKSTHNEESFVLYGPDNMLIFDTIDTEEMIIGVYPGVDESRGAWKVELAQNANYYRPVLSILIGEFIFFDEGLDTERRFYRVDCQWQEQISPSGDWVDVTNEVLEIFPDINERLSVILAVYIPSVTERNTKTAQFVVPSQTVKQGDGL